MNKFCNRCKTTKDTSMFYTDNSKKCKIRSICKACDKYDKGDHRCMACGCFLNAKARFGHERCPLDKWGPYGESKDN